jgi:plastocyanin
MRQIVPVVMGLVIGAAFVLLFGIIFQVGQSVSIVRITQTDSNLKFEPQVITIWSGVNNTVRWVNMSDIPALIAADNDQSDPAFYNATKDFVMILPYHSYEYTFTNLGKIGYHGRPSERGAVIVVNALPVK